MILTPSLAEVERTAQSDAERKVARLLSAIPEPDSVAFWSKKLRTHPSKQQAEADFVVLWKGVVVVIEVKGGGIKKFQGGWFTTDRNDDWHPLRESPMDQAQGAMYALQQILRDMKAGWVRLGAIVITPDTVTPPDSIEWKGSQWLAKESMTRDGLAKAFDKVKAEMPQPPSRTRIEPVKTLRDFLFGEFALIPAIDAQRGAVLDEQNFATSGQARVLSGLSKNSRILVRGGAGTGKSIVLAEAAKQEAAEGRSVLVTFRSPGLLPFFRLLLSNELIEVLTFGDQPLRDKQFDVILIDEAQDLMTADAMDLLGAFVKGGIERGRWRMFLDHNNQAQVDGKFDSDVLELVATNAIEYDLSTNVRNTKAIVHVVQEYLGADVGDPGIVNGERLQWRWVEHGRSSDEVPKIAKEMKASGVRSADIWVIPVQAHADLDEMRHGLRTVSPRVAKGLEADHVIVCDLPAVFDEASTAAFYVAVTRARVTLHIVATPDDKKQLQALLKAQGRQR